MVLLGGLEIIAAGYIIHKHNKNKKERARLEDEEAEIVAAAQEKERERQRRRRSKSREHYEGKNGRRYHSADERREERYHAGSGSAQMLAGPPPYAPVAGPQFSGSTYQLPTHAGSQHLPHPDIKYGWTDASPAPPHPSHQPASQDPSFPPTGWPQHWPQSKSPEPNARVNGRDKSRSRVRLAVPGEAGVGQPGEESERRRRGRGRERMGRRSESESGEERPPRYRS